MDRKEIENSLEYKASKSAIDWYQTHQKADGIEGFEKGYKQGYEQAEKDLTDKAKFSSGWDGFYYGQGYKQAEKDLMEKFKMWVAHNGYTAKDAEAVYNDFKQFITDN